jgi:hypothetical protein
MRIQPILVDWRAVGMLLSLRAARVYFLVQKIRVSNVDLDARYEKANNARE